MHYTNSLSIWEIMHIWKQSGRLSYLDTAHLQGRRTKHTGYGTLNVSAYKRSVAQDVHVIDFARVNYGAPSEASARNRTGHQHRTLTWKTELWENPRLGLNNRTLKVNWKTCHGSYHEPRSRAPHPLMSCARIIDHRKRHHGTLL